MASQWWDSVVLLIVTLTVCLTTSAFARTERGRVNENTTLPETTSLQGKIQGVNMVTRNNRTIYGFLGIPFGEPPVGDLRFKAPIAAGAWNGTFNASSDPDVCPQLDSGVVIGNEDCLYLQVYTPKLPANGSTLLPVMVFIIGGGFFAGTIAAEGFGPTFLLDKDVLLVVPASRLGPLGYLSTGDEASPGNYGLKDLVLALKWVQDNIQYFGGDPDQVTLAGASSGSMTVSYLSLADSTDGLFHKCITESGTAFAIELGLPVELHVNHTVTLAKNFGCPTNSTTLLVNCLRNVNVSRLIDTDNLFFLWNAFPTSIWIPAIEPDIEGALLTDSITNLVAAGKIRDVPWLTLNVQDEGLTKTMRLYENADLFEELLDKIDFLLPYFIGYWTLNDNDVIAAYTSALKSYYLDDLTADRSLLLKNLTDMAGDAVVYWPTYHLNQQQLVRARNPLYFTSFQYRGVLSLTYVYSGGNPNYTQFVAHGDELIYLFEDIQRNCGPADYEYSESDFVMVDTMVQLWTSFMTNGTPTITDSNKSTTIWKPYSSLNNYLRIGNGSDTALGVEYDLNIERILFWEELASTWYTPSSTSGNSRREQQLLPILLCVAVLWAFCH